MTSGLMALAQPQLGQPDGLLVVEALLRADSRPQQDLRIDGLTGRQLPEGQAHAIVASTGPVGLDRGDQGEEVTATAQGHRPLAQGLAVQRVGGPQLDPTPADDHLEQPVLVELRQRILPDDLDRQVEAERFGESDEVEGSARRPRRGRTVAARPGRRAAATPAACPPPPPRPAPRRTKAPESRAPSTSSRANRALPAEVRCTHRAVCTSTGPPSTDPANSGRGPLLERAPGRSGAPRPSLQSDVTPSGPARRCARSARRGRCRWPPAGRRGGPTPDRAGGRRRSPTRGAGRRPRLRSAS